MLPLAADHSFEMPMKNQTENQPFEMISRKVARTLSSDENPSEMHLLKPCISPGHYLVPEIIHRLPEINGQSGSPVEPAHGGRL